MGFLSLVDENTALFIFLALFFIDVYAYFLENNSDLIGISIA